MSSVTAPGLSSRLRHGALWIAALALLPTTILVSVAASGTASAKPVRPNQSPGTLISSKLLTGTGVNGTVYLVNYYSESYPANQPVPTTGIVAVPEGTAPEGGWPVVTWAHGTDGSNGSCAPSVYSESDPLSGNIPNINAILAAGYEVTATDYQGEFNSRATGAKDKKILPYLVGMAAASDTINIVLAARAMGATADASTDYVVWGHSEGGQTSMYAWEDAAADAPGLNLMGVLALAPPSNFLSAPTTPDLLEYVEQSANFPFLFLAAGGYQQAYGKTLAPVAELLTKAGKKELPHLKKKGQCLDQIGLTLDIKGFSHWFKISDNGTLPTAWATLVNENDPANFTSAPAVPLVIVSGSDDTTVDPATTADLANELCDLSSPPTQSLQRWLYTGLDHSGIADPPTAPIDDYLGWTAAAFGGTTSTFVPSGSESYPVTVTNSCG